MLRQADREEVKVYKDGIGNWCLMLYFIGLPAYSILIPDEEKTTLSEDLRWLKSEDKPCYIASMGPSDSARFAIRHEPVAEIDENGTVTEYGYEEYVRAYVEAR